VENLDQLGAANYAKGDFIKAMDAFNHALRVRSQTHVDFDPKTTCKNIHCIADIYSNQRNWKHALEAYRAALYAIRSSKDDDVFETIACLEQKVALVEKQVDMSEKRRMMDVL
jgi:tetratricopeptide (TPR) repeat protein